MEIAISYRYREAREVKMEQSNVVNMFGRNEEEDLEKLNRLTGLTFHSMPTSLINPVKTALQPEDGIPLLTQVCSKSGTIIS